MRARTSDVARFSRELTLPDGAHVRIRAIEPGDEAALVTLYDRLSRQTAYQRFFSLMRRLPPDWAHFLANVDYRRRFALVAEPADRDRLVVAVARYEPTDAPGVAEVAFVVQDAWQGRGLGRALLDDLLRAAQGNSIQRFRAYVLADNARMLDLLARFTEIRRRSTTEGVTEILFVPRAEVSDPSP